MKRLFLLIVVVMLVYWAMASHRWGLIRPAGPPGHRDGRIYTHDRDNGRHSPDEVGREVRQAFKEVHHELREAGHELRDELHRAVAEVRGAFVSDDDAADDQPGAVEREDAEGLPVRIVPGTRVTEAQAMPPVPPRSAIKARHRVRSRPAPPVFINAGVAEIPTLSGEISATPERADTEARRRLRETITAWLDPDVPTSWVVPGSMLDAMVLVTSVETVQKDYGPLYITHLKLDTTPARRAEIVRAYNHELVGRRLVNLGGSLGFILICLAAISGYIRADEATKGYYTKRLMMLAAAAVGAGGVLIYQMVT
jgi:hypothetical protein